MRALSTILAFALALGSTSASFAHGGGGGGGGHGGGHYTYIPMYFATGPAVVPPAKTGDYSQIHRIAVLTAVSQTLMLGQQGWLSDHKSIDVSDLKLDDRIDTDLRRYLGARYQIENVPYDRTALEIIPNDKLSNSTKQLDDYLSALKATDVDAFVVVRPDAEGDGPITPGLCLSEGEAGRPFIEANYSIEIIDARTLKVIGHASSRLKLRDVGNPYFAELAAPASLAITPKQVPTIEQRGLLKTQFARLLAISALETLRSLNTGVELPGAGGRQIVPVTSQTDPYRGVKSVAIVSQIGDTLDLADLGTFGGISKESSLPIGGLQIDTKVEGLISKSLDKRFDVKQVTADVRAALSASGTTQIAAIDARLLGRVDADALILVAKLPAPVGYPPYKGIGIAHKSALFSTTTAAFVSYAVIVVDTHSGMVLAAHREAMPPSFIADFPIKAIDNSFWPAVPEPASPPVPLSSAQTEQLYGYVMEQLNAGIPETLLRLRLTGTRISYGPGTDQDEPPTAPASPSLTAAMLATTDAGLE